MSLTPGSRIGPYEVLAAIGAGGMGEVYRARDARLGRDVAIKVLPAAFSADRERLDRFEQEARAAAALNHQNILVVYDRRPVGLELNKMRRKIVAVVNAIQPGEYRELVWVDL